MRTLVVAFAVALGLTSCNAQEKKGDAENNTAMETNTEIHKTPHGTWSVNKEMDKNGNLIRYDSIYSYSYGNINGKEVAPGKTDSLMASFQKYMQDRMPQLPQEMMNPFRTDSLSTEFYENNVFQNNWEDFFPDIKNQLKQMDSIHKSFFQNESGIFPPEEKKN